jgi:radical SAM superfamily enzyme YgiQ (UPF0313 family)
MKICLVNPERFTAQQMPLSLGYLISYLQKYDEENHEFKVIDENAGDYVEKELLKFNPDFVGITSTTPQITRAIEITNFIKNNLDVPVTVGGVHVTLLPKETLLKGNFDVGVIGEGETTFFELVQLLKNKNFVSNDLKKIKGICFKKGRSVIITEERPLIDNLDTIPFPAREFLNLKYYLKPEAVIRGVIKRSAHIMSSRGCPYNCVFCSSFAINRRRLRAHSAEYVISEVEHLIKKYKIEALFFQDDDFYVNRERVKKICELMIERGINDKLVWSIQMRTNWLNPNEIENLKLLKKAGCIQVEFGFESGSPKILGFLKKNTITVEQNHQAINLCKQVGLRVFGNFMIGTVGETQEDLEMTKEFILQHNKDLDSMGIFITTPLPKTELWDVCEKKGLLKGLKWKDLKMDVTQSPRSFSDIFSQEELMKIYKEFTSLSIERYSTGFKIRKFVSHPNRYLKFMVPYFSYKIKKGISKKSD